MYVCYLYVTGPTLIFTETNNKVLKITDNGSMIECGQMSRKNLCNALTDGRYVTGRHYWEMEIPELAPLPDAICTCDLGVVKESCRLQNSFSEGEGFLVQVWRRNVGFDIFITEQNYRPQHFSLFLNCEARSLTVLDRGKNQVLLKHSKLDLSEPLVPFIALKNVKSASVRLVTGDPLAVSEVLGDMFITI